MRLDVTVDTIAVALRSPGTDMGTTRIDSTHDAAPLRYQTTPEAERTRAPALPVLPERGRVASIVPTDGDA